MKIFLITIICIIAYIIISIIVAIIDAKTDIYVEIGNPVCCSNVFIGFLWPITVPIMIGRIFFKTIDNIVKYASKKDNFKCLNRKS